MKKVWFITGASRGLGRSLAEAVLKKGDNVVTAVRNPEHLQDLRLTFDERLLVVKMDVTKKEDIRQGVADTLKRFGRIDVLVNNAGFGIMGATEAFTDDQVRSQLETLKVSTAIPHA